MGEVTSGNITSNKYFVKASDRFWFNSRANGDTNPFPEERWSGIWEVYVDEPKYAKLLGEDGNFDTGNNPGFTEVGVAYDVNQGWVKIQSRAWFDRFVKWFNLFKKLKDLKSRCEILASSRDLKTSNFDALRDLCWSLSQ